MRRADRLFSIVQLLRRRRLTTAAVLADRFEVSERTIYRDIQDLVCSGVPIAGEAGLGYQLRGYDLPPLMFTEDEIEALVLGARIVRRWADPELQRAADEALDKIETVLPERLETRVKETALFALNFQPADQATRTLGPLRQAVRQHKKVQMTYERADGQQSERIVWPLCLSFVPPKWLLSGWCELRRAFRSFRLDRIAELDVLETTFEAEPGRTLDDFLQLVTSGASGGGGGGSTG